jgi:hypothetical protein
VRDARDSSDAMLLEGIDLALERVEQPVREADVHRDRRHGDQLAHSTARWFWMPDRPQPGHASGDAGWPTPQVRGLCVGKCASCSHSA